MKKHTSIYLSEENVERIKKTGNPMNAVIEEALNTYFSGNVNKSQIQKEVIAYLNSPEMQKYYLAEMYKLLVPLLESVMPQHAKKDIYLKFKNILNLSQDS